MNGLSTKTQLAGTVSDYIADTIVDGCLADDPHSDVALKVMFAQNTVVVAGQVQSFAFREVDISHTVRTALRDIYGNSQADKIAVLHSVLWLTCDGKHLDRRRLSDERHADQTAVVWGYAAKGAETWMPHIPSGYSPSKIWRSGAYAARHIAKNVVAAGISDEATVQIAYCAGVAEPVSLYIDTCGTSKIGWLSDGEISDVIRKLIDLRPHSIEKRLELCRPIYAATAQYGHFCDQPDLFAWERPDDVERIIKEFNLRFIRHHFTRKTKNRIEGMYCDLNTNTEWPSNEKGEIPVLKTITQQIAERCSVGFGLWNNKKESLIYLTGITDALKFINTAQPAIVKDGRPYQCPVCCEPLPDTGGERSKRAQHLQRCPHCGQKITWNQNQNPK
jgi:DNA-directed RNA polymerase subunit RPC12/RpoP